MAVTKDKKRRTPQVIKPASFLFFAGFLLFIGCASFNRKQEQIGRRYWQNVLEHQHKKNYSTGNPQAVRNKALKARN